MLSLYGRPPKSKDGRVHLDYEALNRRVVEIFVQVKLWCHYNVLLFVCIHCYYSKHVYIIYNNKKNATT